MSIENTAPAYEPTTETTSVELQNTVGQNGSDGADVGDPSAQVPVDAPDQEGSEKPEHRKAAYRFSELSRQIRDLQLEIARRDGLLEAFRSQPAFGQAQNAPMPPEPQAPQAPQPPNPADFPEGQYDPTYLRALARYEAKLEIQNELAQMTARQAEQRQKELDQAAFQAKAQRYQSVYVEAERAGATGAVQVFEIADQRDRTTADLLMQTSYPVDTAEWLADNRDWMQAIMRERDPVRKAVLIGRVDQHVSHHLAQAKGQASARVATPAQAAAPNTSVPAASSVAQPTVRTGGTGGAPFNPATASQDQYEAWRRANPRA
jgi:hypothetical protein